MKTLIKLKKILDDSELKINKYVKLDELYDRSTIYTQLEEIYVIIIFLRACISCKSDDFTITEAYERYKELDFVFDPVNLSIYCKKR